MATGPPLLEVAVNDIDQFLRGLRLRALPSDSRGQEMLADVVLNDFGQQAADGAPTRCQKAHDFGAFSVAG